MAEKKPPATMKDGYVPLQKGYVPKGTAVQGGYIPTTSQVASPPPKGGSAVAPPPNKK